MRERRRRVTRRCRGRPRTTRIGRPLERRSSRLRRINRRRHSVQLRRATRRVTRMAVRKATRMGVPTATRARRLAPLGRRQGRPPVTAIMRRQRTPLLRDMDRLAQRMATAEEATADRIRQSRATARAAVLDPARRTAAVAPRLLTRRPALRPVRAEAIAPREAVAAEELHTLVAEAVEAEELHTPVVEAGTAGADTQRFTSTLELWAVCNGRPFSMPRGLISVSFDCFACDG